MSGGSDTSTSTTGPSEFIKPYLDKAFDRGEALYENAPLYRPPMNPYMQAGNTGIYDLGSLGMNRRFGAEALDRGQMFAANVLSGHGLNIPGQQMLGLMAGNPTVSPFGAELGRTAGGAYTSGGPMYEATEERIRRAMPGIMSQYALGGREGSGLMGTAMAREATDAYRMANEQERARQVAAAQAGLGTQMQAANLLQSGHLGGLNIQSQLAQMAPALSAADYLAAQQMRGAGQYAEEHERRRVEEPWERYERWMGSFAPLTGATGSTTQQTGPGADPLQSIMGIGMMAGGLGWSPFG